MLMCERHSTKCTRKSWDGNQNIPCAQKLCLKFVQIDLGPCINWRRYIIHVTHVQLAVSSMLQPSCCWISKGIVVTVVWKDIIYSSDGTAYKVKYIAGGEVKLIMPDNDSSMKIIHYLTCHGWNCEERSVMLQRIFNAKVWCVTDK